MRRYTEAELTDLHDREGVQSDLARVNATTQDELERDIASDPDWRDIPRDWYERAEMVIPASKKLLSVRLDADVLEWFRAQGPGYQTRMNAVLRAYVEQKRRA